MWLPDPMVCVQFSSITTQSLVGQEDFKTRYPRDLLIKQVSMHLMSEMRPRYSEVLSLGIGPLNVRSHLNPDLTDWARLAGL